MTAEEVLARARELVDRAERTCGVGDRVRLVRCNDPYTRLRPGVEGTVRFVDSFGTLHVSWDDGSSLGLVEEDGDRWEVLP